MDSIFDSYTYYKKKGVAVSQSMVEVKLSAVEEDVSSVLAATVSVCPISSEAENGRVAYSGRAAFCIVYEDKKGVVCSIERGVEFSHKCETDVEFSSSLTLFTPIKTSVRREGASICITAIIQAESTLFGEETFSYLKSGEELICRNGEIEVGRSYPFDCSFEAEDSFDCEYVGDVLLHSENVMVTDVSCDVGEVKIEGEINLNVCALREDGSLACFERLIPFTATAVCDGAMPRLSADANVFVKKSCVSAVMDEGKLKSSIRIEVELGGNGVVYDSETMSAVTDCFSEKNNLSLSFGEVVKKECALRSVFSQRVSGKCALEGKLDFSCKLEALIPAGIEANCTFVGNKGELQGGVAATLVYSSEGAHRSAEVVLPFTLPLPETQCDRIEVSVLPCGMSARQKQEGEVEADVTLKICISSYNERSYSYISTVEEGAEREDNSSAFSVYIPRKGDGVWEIAKRIAKAPEEVTLLNPDLRFPLSEDDRIILYRQKK